MYDIAHFRLTEFQCQCGCGLNITCGDILIYCETLRRAWGDKIRVTSGTRCAQHNRNVGGVQNSKHVTGEAADLAPTPLPDANTFQRFVALASRLAGEEYKVIEYETWIHVHRKKMVYADSRIAIH